MAIISHILSWEFYECCIKIFSFQIQCCEHMETPFAIFGVTFAAVLLFSRVGEKKKISKSDCHLPKKIVLFLSLKAL